MALVIAFSVTYRWRPFANMIFSQLSMHYTICGAVCFSLPISLVKIERIYILCPIIIIIIKSEVWTITHCLGLGHETMVWAVCLSIFLLSMMTSSNGNIFRDTGPLLPVNSPHKGQWRGALIFSMICAWTNSSVNGGDLRRNRTHYDVTEMLTLIQTIWSAGWNYLPIRKHRCQMDHYVMLHQL